MWIFFNINFIAFEVQYKFFLSRRAETLFIYVIYFFTTTRIYRRPGTYIHVLVYVPAYAYLTKNEREPLLYLMIR